MSELERLFTDYGTDKGIWGYTPAYERYFEYRRDQIKSVLEIGICGYRDIPGNVVGASLFAWRDYFPEAHIYGLDIDDRFIFNDQQRISTYKCDAYRPHDLNNALMKIMSTSSSMRHFDFICDDAVHDPLAQIHLLRHLWPFLAKDGVYAIEDVCPYKVPHGDLVMHMEAYFPKDAVVHQVHTHKDERLLLVTRG